MDWARIKRILIPPDNRRPPESNVPWVKAANNPWGVDVLDVRPTTLTRLSFSEDQQCALNAMSFVNDDGSGFIGQAPPVDRTVACHLRFPIDRPLADGVLFTPLVMEHKWAIFHHRNQIICVRSWLRQVGAIATVEPHEDHVVVTSIRGALGNGDEDPALTVRLFDCLLRIHPLNLMYPVPLRAGMERDPDRAAIWCFALFGNRATFATPHDFPRRDPEVSLSTRPV